MDCMRCGNAMTAVSTDKCILAEPPLRIVGVPIRECPVCGWQYTEPDVARQVDALRASGETDTVEAMRVVWYDRTEGSLHRMALPQKPGSSQTFEAKPLSDARGRTQQSRTSTR